jgi:dipeptidyl-peptidase 4
VTPDTFLRDYAETRRFQAGRPTAVRLAAGGAAALFLRSGPRSAVQALHETDLATGATRLLVDPERLAAGAALTPEERARLERQRITARGLTHFELSSDGSTVIAGLGGKLFAVDRETGAATALDTGEAPLDPRLSPDGALLAYARGGELHVLDLATNRERALTSGAPTGVSRGLAEFVAQEEMDRDRGFWWSPDGRLLAYQETDEREVEKLSLSDPLRPEQPPVVFAYPRAGGENAKVRLGVVPVAGGETTWVTWDAERWPYLCRVSWERGAPLAIQVLDRAQQETGVLAVDPATGRTKVLLVEKDAAWVNLAKRLPLWRGDGQGFFWMTERSGAPEVELRDASGERVATWIPASAGFGELVGWDEERSALWFIGGPDPTQDQLYVVRGGAPPERVGPPGPASVSAVLAADGATVAITRTTLRDHAQTEVWSVTGAAPAVRLATVPSVAEEPPAPTTEIRKVGAGEGLWSSVTRPRGLEGGSKLPVIVQVYGGPQHREVTHRPAILQQWLADRGFVVVSIDGRGTPRRGRAFERAIRDDLAGPPLADQIAGLQALAKELPELDLARVGITGWSYGGFMSAVAVLRRPDVFKAGVAGAPVVDWRDYDTFYTERYLGLPQSAAAAYDRSGALAAWAAPARPLLVVHGTADDNVWFLHSLRLSNALFRAGRPFELLPLAGVTHLPADPEGVEWLWERVRATFEARL